MKSFNTFIDSYNKDCVFCDVNRIESHITYRKHKGVDFMIFEPLKPVTAGHLMVVPKEHYLDASENSDITGFAFSLASIIADEKGYINYNLITNKGKHADQTVFHLHIHIIPRYENDNVVTIWDRFSVRQMMGDTYDNI